jgi:N-acetylglucosamine kinase-like BadF-type ATPase
MPVLAVDGGNTKTIGIVVHGDGTVAGWGRSGPSDPYQVSLSGARTAVSEAAAQALRQAGVGAQEITAACFGMAGADWPEDYEDLRKTLSPVVPAAECVVKNDAITGLVSSSPDGAGIAAIVGTGVAIGARNYAGDEWHGSFWTNIEFGRATTRETLYAITDSYLGIAPPTALAGRVFEYRSVGDARELLRSTRRLEGGEPLDHGVMTRILLETARDGDVIARGIVERLGQTCACYAVAAARQVNLNDRPYVVLGGGGFRTEGNGLRGAIIKSVREDLPNARVVETQTEPVVGSAMLALETSGLTVVDSTKKRLLATLASATHFDG